MMRRIVLASALIALAACAREQPEDAVFHGMVLTPPRGKPDFTLVATGGEQYRFRAETDGRLTLLFFGYTHCPDVCPMHMANIAAVVKKLDYDDRQRIRVVFVTTDPDRDTPQRLRAWLDNFDPSFVGLAGPPALVDQVQQAVGLTPARLETPTIAKTGAPAEYGVSHAAAVLAFTPDDSLRVVYPFGVRQQDWAADIPQLLKVKGRG